MRSSLCGMSFAAWRRSQINAGVRVNMLNFTLTGFHIQCYSTHRASASRQRKVEPRRSREDTSEFYVVRKGDLVGVYKSFSDCQKQLSVSVCNPAVSVYKGHSLRKETEEYLASHGLKDALYSINAVDVKDDLFGTLIPCPFQVTKKEKTSRLFISLHPCSFLCIPIHFKNYILRIHQKLFLWCTILKELSRFFFLLGFTLDVIGHSPIPAGSSTKHLDLVKCIENPPLLSDNLSCILEFDGASKGNPGRAGAGAILRSEDGTVVSRLREGLGVTTSNVAEYRAMILGIKYALKKGFKQIRIRGDSKLVCNQVNGVWRTRHQNLVDLYKEVKELKEKFLSFTIHHVRREFNSDADAEANSAIDLPSGEVYEVSAGVD